ncbi:CBS domain-containing protein [Streptomyces actinomycinicus]|uniref:CBS domain-containing protein n=1 Tax=Streptomyces actinomycinicus TaxID=1695166 RepID=A0A937ERB1_9ACTN|nr:CBS domain-containing protein [Streptomyces actinomycinicus]MBL1086761.1 CBS domain-containing protein [Streptomyces actinomycinicus]
MSAQRRGARGVELPSPEEFAAGPRRNLLEELHLLYRAAGPPSVREISEGIKEAEAVGFRATMDRNLVAALLSGRRWPTEYQLETLVRFLAQGALRRKSPDEEANDFARLHRAAANDQTERISLTPLPEAEPHQVKLGDTLVRDIMTPRVDLVAIEDWKTVRQACIAALRSGRSRIPVISQDGESIIGMVYLKDLVRHIFVSHKRHDGESELVSVVLRGVDFVHAAQNAGDVLREMQRTHNHAAVVIDDHGTMVGIVTMEDILEVIVGPIEDEHDQRSSMEPRHERKYRVLPRFRACELAGLYSFEASVATEAATVGELLAESLGHAPASGSSTVMELRAHVVKPPPREVGPKALRLTAESHPSDQHQLLTVLVEPINAASAEEGSPDEAT